MGTISWKVANLKLDTRPGSVQECETDDNQHVTSVREKKKLRPVLGRSQVRNLSAS